MANDPAADLLSLLLHRAGGELRLPVAEFNDWDGTKWALERWDDIATRELVFRLVPVNQPPGPDVEVRLEPVPEPPHYTPIEPSSGLTFPDDPPIPPIMPPYLSPGPDPFNFGGGGGFGGAGSGGTF